MWKQVACALAVFSAASPASSQKAGGWDPASIPWQTAAANGTRYALLEGDRTRGNQPFLRLLDPRRHVGLAAFA